MQHLTYQDVSIPKFHIPPEDMKSVIQPVNIFDLSSHQRARQAIEFGLSMRAVGSNIFVLGGGHSGRLTATLDLVQRFMQDKPSLDDWVYLNNFPSPNRPLPFRIPSGSATLLKKMMIEFIQDLTVTLKKSLLGPHFTHQVNQRTAELEQEIHAQISELQKQAQEKGFDIIQEDDTLSIIPRDSQEDPPGHPPKAQDLQRLKEVLMAITTKANVRSQELSRDIQEQRQQHVHTLIVPLLSPLKEKFEPHLGSWFQELYTDILQNVSVFLQSDDTIDWQNWISNRYAVNTLVNHPTTSHIIIDPSPTYESLFGSIKYYSASQGYETDFTMIRAGNLHRANGGMLILRAEALAANPELWNALKIALRDRVIRIEERHRDNTIPILDAPDPHPIPLDIQIFLVGDPSWYYRFFFHDPEFKSYFKIKAEIDPDMPATPENISIYTRLMRQISIEHLNKEIDHDAIQYLLGYSARWVRHRQRISSQFELLRDVLYEANAVSQSTHSRLETQGPISESETNNITIQDIQQAIHHRRKRNASLEDRMQRDLEEGMVKIATSGARVGCVNGLTVLTTGDHHHGLPSRISARTHVGQQGIVNIERLIDMSGPIQQKGALILDGFLNGLFSQDKPVSCTCSLTFEQNHSEVEGDSAVLAEAIAILSSLSGIPVKQNIAVTGSMNHLGEVQAVGGIHHKIEGFYRLCQHRGLDGTHGVIIPASNAANIILKDEITDAVRDQRFHIWTVDTVIEAIHLLMALPPEKQGQAYEIVYAAANQKLHSYHQKLIQQVTLKKTRPSAIG